MANKTKNKTKNKNFFPDEQNILVKHFRFLSPKGTNIHSSIRNFGAFFCIRNLEPL